MSGQTDRSGFYDYPFMKFETEEAVWAVAGVIPYLGSDTEGAFKKISVVCGKQGGATTFSVRVFDRTNALLIARKSNMADDYPVLLDLGSITNVPEGLAILEVQIKKTAGVAGKTVTVASVVMEF